MSDEPLEPVVAVDRSDAQQLAFILTNAIGYEAAHQAIDVICRKFSNIELAALYAYWKFWARKKQLAPKGNWRVWGKMGGRGWGKSVTNCKYVTDEVQKGNAPLVGICAQNLEMTTAIQVSGPSGLVTLSPPWFKAEYKPSENKVIWPNGAYAIERTPEVPGAIRGLEYMLFWYTEIQSWPVATMMEAHMNIEISTRLGYARRVWDASAKKGHPILKELVREAEEDPEKNILTRGHTKENADNLADGYVDGLIRKYEGKPQGAEELEGNMDGDEEDAITTEAIINAYRRPHPGRFRRKIMGVDPATTEKKRSDTTGIVWAGEGFDEDCYPIGNRSGKHKTDAWVNLVIDTYLNEEIDLIIAETNKGGNLVVTTLKAVAMLRKLQVIVIGKDEHAPSRKKGVIFVRETYSRGDKMARARPMGVAYSEGRMHHVGEKLGELEGTLTTYAAKSGQDSPGDLDALVFVATEILKLKTDNEEADPKLSMVGVPEMARRLREGGLRTDSISQLLRSHSGRGI
jgi:phage terminase large subunit-like protein